MKKRFAKLRQLIAILLCITITLPSLSPALQVLAAEPAILQSSAENTATASDAVNEATLGNAAYESRIFTGEGWEIRYIPYSYAQSKVNAGITVTNTGFEKLENWKLILTTNSFTPIESWGMGEVKREGNEVLFDNAGHNQDLAPGESLQITLLAECGDNPYPDSAELRFGKRRLNANDFCITFTVMNQWQGGANAILRIENISDMVIEDWRLEFDYAGTIPGFWTAKLVSVENGHYSITNAGYNANIAPGEFVETGFTVYFDGELPTAPSNYVLNDLALGSVPEEYIKYILYPLYLQKNGYQGTVADVDIHADYDGDGLTNEEEYRLGTLPGNADTDGDGLNDYEEVYRYGTNPTEYDTDNDKLGDGCEILNGTNPLEKDTNGNGILDGDEPVIDQKLTGQSYKSADFEWAGAELEIQVSGHGDYSRQIQVLTNPHETTYSSLEYLVTGVIDISHNDNMDYDGALLSFHLSPDILAKYPPDDLCIARMEEGGPVFCDTYYDEDSETVCSRVDKLCKYVVISKSTLIKVSDFSESAAMLSDGKAEIVFIIDTTGSMGSYINNVKNNLSRIAQSLSENKVDVRYGLVTFRDIYSDGAASTVAYPWSDGTDEFITRLNGLSVSGGGDGPETPFDGIEKALQLNSYSGYTRYFVLVTDANYHNGVRGNGSYTIHDAVNALKQEQVNLSVVTYSSHYSLYNQLVTETNGVLCNIQENFFQSFEPLADRIRVDAHESNRKVIRLSDLSLANVAIDDYEKDTDMDGLPDLLEIGPLQTREIFGYTIQYYANYSNPNKRDTDGDFIPDGEDPRVKTFDNTYINHYDLLAQSSDYGDYLVEQWLLNTANFSYQMFCPEYTVVDFVDDLNIGKLSSQALYKHFAAYLEVLKLSEYSMSELIYIGHTDPDLMKWMAQDLNFEDWKRLYAGITFGIYDGSTGKILYPDGGEEPSDYEINMFFYLPTKAASVCTYIGETISYLIGGRYVNDGTWLATGADLTLAFFGLDLYSDIRDTIYLVHHWENKTENFVEAGLVAIQYLPIVGAFCKQSKWYACIQTSKKTCKILRTTEDLLNKVKTGVIKRTTELVFTAKQAVDELGAKVCCQIQQKLYELSGLMPALDTRANGAIMQICSEFPDDTKQMLKTSSKAEIEQITEKIVKECCDDTGKFTKNADEITQDVQKQFNNLLQRVDLDDFVRKHIEEVVAAVKKSKPNLDISENSPLMTALKDNSDLLNQLGKESTERLEDVVEKFIWDNSDALSHLEDIDSNLTSHLYDLLNNAVNKPNKWMGAREYAAKVSDKTKVLGNYAPSTSDYDIIKAELLNAGISTPPYMFQVHHIIPLNEKDAAAAREILEKLGIDINSAANGIFLPQEVNVYVGNTALHIGGHTKDYSKYVNDLIEKEFKNGGGKEDIINLLNRFREELLNGTLKVNAAVR